MTKKHYNILLNDWKLVKIVWGLVDWLIIINIDGQ